MSATSSPRFSVELAGSRPAPNASSLRTSPDTDAECASRRGARGTAPPSPPKPRTRERRPRPVRNLVRAKGSEGPSKSKANANPFSLALNRNRARLFREGGDGGAVRVLPNLTCCDVGGCVRRAIAARTWGRPEPPTRPPVQSDLGALELRKGGRLEGIRRDVF